MFASGLWRTLLGATLLFMVGCLDDQSGQPDLTGPAGTVMPQFVIGDSDDCPDCFRPGPGKKGDIQNAINSIGYGDYRCNEIRSNMQWLLDNDQLAITFRDDPIGIWYNSHQQYSDGTWAYKVDLSTVNWNWGTLLDTVIHEGAHTIGIEDELEAEGFIRKCSML